MKFKSVSVFDLFEEEHICPHCDTKLSLCDAPPVHVGDGLGWGSEYLFICLNDECSLFAGGWSHVENQYGHVGSYRHMKLPGSDEAYNMMVAGRGALPAVLSILNSSSSRTKDIRRKRRLLLNWTPVLRKKTLSPHSISCWMIMLE